MAQAVRIVCVGKLKEDYFCLAAAEYIKRLGRFGGVEITEIAEARVGKESAAEIARALESEAAEILKRLKGRVVVLDSGGSQLSSPELAAELNRTMVDGQELTFVIGSSHGLSQRVKDRAALTLSFGRITYPHQLVRVVLLEQVYRAFSILANSDYHK